MSNLTLKTMQFVPVKEHRLRHQIIMSFPFLFEMDAYICMTTGYHISFSTTSLSEKYKEKAMMILKLTHHRPLFIGQEDSNDRFLW